MSIKYIRANMLVNFFSDIQCFGIYSILLRNYIQTIPVFSPDFFRFPFKLCNFVIVFFLSD